MGKKNSLAAFNDILEEKEIESLNDTYSKPSVSKDKEKKEPPQKEEERPQNKENQEVIVKDSGQTISKLQKAKKTNQKSSIDVNFTTIRISKRKMKGIMILADSGEFEGVSNKTEMLDYIVSYFFERKQAKKILNKGIQLQ